MCLWKENIASCPRTEVLASSRWEISTFIFFLNFQTVFLTIAHWAIVHKKALHHLTRHPTKPRDAALTMPVRQIPNDHWATSNRGLNADTIHKQLYTAQLERQRRSILSHRFAWLRVWDQRTVRDGLEWRGLADGWLSLWYYRDSHLPNYWQGSLITTIFPNRIREPAYQCLPSVSRSPHSAVDHLWKIRQSCSEWPI